MFKETCNYKLFLYKDFLIYGDDYENIRKASNDIRLGCDKENTGMLLILNDDDFRFGVDLENIKIRDIKYSMSPLEFSDFVIYKDKCLKNRLG
jgi:hypothetical protein